MDEDYTAVEDIVIKEKKKEQRTDPYIGPKEDALPEHVDFETFIETGYRINFNTWNLSLCSLFRCHNETANVWTHLLGGLVFIAVMIPVESALNFKNGGVPIWPLFVAAATSAIGFLMSAYFHLFGC
jgi:adiponectin receptor